MRKRDVTPLTEKGKRFLVEAPYIIDRQADYHTGNKVVHAFENVGKSVVKNIDFCGNVHDAFKVDKTTRRIKLQKNWMTPVKNSVSLGAAISPSLALYRLICMFPHPEVICGGSQFYKFPWTFFVRHRATGTIICFSEWKGAFGFRLEQMYIESLDPQFKKDLIMILELMLSNNSPHPYDGLVAGSVA